MEGRPLGAISSSSSRSDRLGGSQSMASSGDAELPLSKSSHLTQPKSFAQMKRSPSAENLACSSQLTVLPRTPMPSSVKLHISNDQRGGGS